MKKHDLTNKNTRTKTNAKTKTKTKTMTFREYLQRAIFETFDLGYLPGAVLRAPDGTNNWHLASFRDAAHHPVQAKMNSFHRIKRGKRM